MEDNIDLNKNEGDDNKKESINENINDQNIEENNNNSNKEINTNNETELKSVNVEEIKVEIVENKEIKKVLLVDFNHVSENKVPSETRALSSIPIPSKIPLNKKIDYESLYKYNNSKDIMSLSQAARVLKEALLDKSLMIQILRAINCPMNSEILVHKIDDDEIIKKISFICAELLLDENRSQVIEELFSEEILNVLFEQLDQVAPLENLSSAYFKMLINRMLQLKREILLEYLVKVQPNQEYPPAKKLLEHCYNDNIFVCILKLLDSEIPPSLIPKTGEFNLSQPNNVVTLVPKQPVDQGEQSPPVQRLTNTEGNQGTGLNDQSPPLMRKNLPEEKDVESSNGSSNTNNPLVIEQKNLKLPETPLQRRKSSGTNSVLPKPVFWSSSINFIDILFDMMDLTVKYEKVEEISDFELSCCEEASKMICEALRRSNTHVVLFRNMLVKCERVFWITLGLNVKTNSTPTSTPTSSPNTTPNTPSKNNGNFQRKYHKSIFCSGTRILICIFAQVNKYYVAQRQQNILQSTIEKFVKYLPYFVTPLSINKTDSLQFGFAKFEAVKLVCLILRSKFYDTFEQTIIDYKFFKIIIQHFFIFKNCNIFHNYFIEFGILPLIKRETYSNKKKLVRLVLNEYELIENMVSHFFEYDFNENLMVPQNNPLMKNCFNGHLFTIANSLNILHSVDSQLFPTNVNFKEFYDNKIPKLAKIQITNNNTNSRTVLPRVQTVAPSLMPINQPLKLLPQQLSPINSRILPSSPNSPPVVLKPVQTLDTQLTPVNLQPVNLQPVNITLQPVNVNMKPVNLTPVNLQPVNVSVQSVQVFSVNVVNTNNNKDKGSDKGNENVDNDKENNSVKDNNMKDNNVKENSVKEINVQPVQLNPVNVQPVKLSPVLSLKPVQLNSVKVTIAEPKSLDVTSNNSTGIDTNTNSNTNTNNPTQVSQIKEIKVDPVQINPVQVNSVQINPVQINVVNVEPVIVQSSVVSTPVSSNVGPVEVQVVQVVERVEDINPQRVITTPLVVVPTEVVQVVGGDDQGNQSSNDEK